MKSRAKRPSLLMECCSCFFRTETKQTRVPEEMTIKQPVVSSPTKLSVPSDPIVTFRSLDGDYYETEDTVTPKLFPRSLNSKP